MRRLFGFIIFSASSGLCETPFPNFETAPVHAVELAPDGNTLAVCHLADHRLLLFNVSTGLPVQTASIRVGHDPTAVRFHTTNEAWVVNHISSTISVIDTATHQPIAILATKGGPSDIVFAGTPTRAYVTCTRQNVVQVFDPISRALTGEIPILGNRPTALSKSPDGSKVYAAIFESGNNTTIIAPELTDILVAPSFSAVSDTDGPYAGQDPPPNAGVNFDPPRNPYVEPTSLPKGSLIVRKNVTTGAWKDDNNGDWTPFISGAKSARTGRIAGWDMPDRDLAVIDTSTQSVTYATGLMNLCMATAVNPVTGKIAVIGTEAMNHIRFEPKLKATFLRVNLALVDPVTLTKTIHDLNPHLDYNVRSIPQSERDKSLGDPRGIVWNGAGTRAYVTGLGSRNLVIIEAAGQRIQPAAIDLGEGPTGLALDEPRNRLYVFNHFSASISTLNTNTNAVVSTLALADPTPEFIRKGRRMLIDTRLHSGLGHVSCASCHPNLRFDRLAWDLGVPNGETDARNIRLNGADLLEQLRNLFHPMKGPMVTLSLQDISPNGSSALHWRGDRPSIHAFDITFPDLLGADAKPSVSEMEIVSKYLATVQFPPNLNRGIDNTLPTNLPLPGHFTPPGVGSKVPLPNGNAQNGRTLFVTDLFPEIEAPEKSSCSTCHESRSGRSLEVEFTNAPRNGGLRFRSPQLRPLADKVGFDLTSNESTAGFGFMHDGRFDTLSHFINANFGISDPQQLADMIALMLSFQGAFLSPTSDKEDIVNDPPAALGKQMIVTSATAPTTLAQLVAVCDDPDSAIQLIAWQRSGSADRSWLYDATHHKFVESERLADRFTTAQLLALASTAAPITFMAVTRGTGARMTIDSDSDGIGNLVEISSGTNPNDPASPMPPRLDELDIPDFRHIGAHPGQRIHRELKDVFTTIKSVGKTITFSNLTPQAMPPGATLSAAGRIDWFVQPLTELQTWTMQVRITIAEQPGEYFDRSIFFSARPLNYNLFANVEEASDFYTLDWTPMDSTIRIFYDVETSDDLIHWSRAALSPQLDKLNFWNDGTRPKHFWRITPKDED